MSHGGKEIAGVLHRNDQYLIGGGEIIFMAVATESIPRTLVYQKYFSDRKSTFALPEIVERMERAQDDVIRADHRGSFLISGPAGSGKTTLALHRVAYLLQSPEFQKIFHPQDILILVQDDATKAYFDALLPSLGILNVSISTFSLWARERLELSVYDFVSRYGTNELERDRYEHAKAQALLHETSASFSGKQPFVFLTRVYQSFFDSDLQKCFSRQRKEKLLDRFDLTILLAARMRAQGGLFKREKIYAEYTGEARFHWEMVPVRYSLILLDEIQNYLPEQVRIIRSCISPHTEAMTYIGDLSQQTSLATLRDWDSIGERFGEGRAITLEKVYRSTRQILRYVQGEGYTVELTPELREGKAVTVLPKPFREDECSRILASLPQDTLVGILGITPEDIEPYYSFASSKVRVLTVNHAQGVEFDAVIFLYPSLDLNSYPEALLLEKQKVLKDQIYVALTRAMHELYVVR
jgi:DNA helicase IV